MTKILITDPVGYPRYWSPIRDAVLYYAQDKVLHSYGQNVKTFLGGRNRHGEQSRIDVAAILFCRGPVAGQKWLDRVSVFAERKIVFARDRNQCAYCGDVYPNVEDHSGEKRKLTIDHIQPTSKGGKNVWMNVVAACKSCNHRKGQMTPEEANMPLLFAPYVPTFNEKMILKERVVLADQQEFLLQKVPKTSRLWQ